MVNKAGQTVAADAASLGSAMSDFAGAFSDKLTATIVDAPDLPPEDCEFFITEAGIADSEEVAYGGSVKDELPTPTNSVGAVESPKKGDKRKTLKKTPEPEVLIAPETGNEA